MLKKPHTTCMTHLVQVCFISSFLINGTVGQTHTHKSGHTHTHAHHTHKLMLYYSPQCIVIHFISLCYYFVKYVHTAGIFWGHFFFPNL